MRRDLNTVRIAANVSFDMFDDLVGNASEIGCEQLVVSVND